MGAFNLLRISPHVSPGKCIKYSLLLNFPGFHRPQSCGPFFMIFLLGVISLAWAVQGGC